MNIKYYLAILKGRWSLSLVAWYVLTPVSIFAFYIRGRIFLELSISNALLFSIFINLTTSLNFYTFNKSLLRKRYKEEQKLFHVFLAYFSIWLVNSIVEIILTKYLLQKPLHIYSEIIASIVPTIVGLILTNISIALIANGIKNQHLLNEEIFDLSLENAAVNANLRLEKEKLISAVQNLLLDQLKMIKANVEKLNIKSTQSQIEQTAMQIEKYSTDIIRGLAHRFGEIPTTENSKSMGKLSFNLKFSKLKPYFSTEFFVATELVAGGFLQAYRNGFVGVLLQLGISLTAYLLALLGAKMLQFFETQKVKFSFALTYVLAFFLILYNMLNLFQNILIELPFPFSSFELSLRFSLAFILTSGFISALEWIKSTNDKLEEIKKLNVSEIEFKERELRSTRARISAALHGPIQGRLAGIAMALRFNELEKGKSELLLSRIYQDLIPQLDLISGDLQEIFDGKNPRKNDLSLEKNLIDLESEWGFLLNIDWKLSKDLAASQNARFIDDILLICNEAIANSVRHGNASQVSLEISKLDNVVILSIIDNGTGVLKGFVGSMGLETIRGISTDYSLTNVENGGAKLSISLPLEKYLDQLI